MCNGMTQVGMYVSGYVPSTALTIKENGLAHSSAAGSGRPIAWETQCLIGLISGKSET